jgi:catechol 2,3-dioxygenase-like lactoylglutathione lyase family enzyme
MNNTDLTNVTNFNYSGEKIFDQAQDFLPINGTDYVELYVGNAKQAAHFYKTAFGFQELAYCGLETGVRDRVSYVLVQDKIRLVLTTPFDPDGDIGPETLKKAIEPPHTQTIDRFCELRLHFLKSLHTFWIFGRGWTNRVNNVRKQAHDMSV